MKVDFAAVANLARVESSPAPVRTAESALRIDNPRRHETRSEELLALLQALLVAVSNTGHVGVHWGSAGRALRESATLVAALVLQL